MSDIARLTDFPFPLPFGIHFTMQNIEYIKFHTHDYWEATVILGGSIENYTKTSKDILTRGSLMLIPPEYQHGYRFIKNQKVPCLNVMINRDVFEGFCNEINPAFYGKIRNQKLPFSHYLTENKIQGITDTVRNLQLLDSDDNENRAIILKLLLSYILRTVYEKMLFTKAEFPDWLNNFLNVLTKPDNISLLAKDAYKLSNFSYPYFSQLFKKYTGSTIHEYLKKQKLNYAANLLETTDKSVLDISSAIGYDSLSHFDHAFKDYYKLTPLEYRKLKGPLSL